MRGHTSFFRENFTGKKLCDGVLRPGELVAQKNRVTPKYMYISTHNNKQK